MVYIKKQTQIDSITEHIQSVVDKIDANPKLLDSIPLLARVVVDKVRKMGRREGEPKPEDCIPAIIVNEAFQIGWSIGVKEVTCLLSDSIEKIEWKKGEKKK